MKARIFISIFCLTIFIQIGQTQTNLPIIPATSDLVDIRDGADFYQGEWTIVPEAKPDIYTSNKLDEWVTFYTDLDSVSFLITEDVVHDFIILYNGKDSAFTQIKYEPSYLDKLKKAAAYDYHDQTNIPKFTYQNQDAPELKTLREAFNLDSIAGGGNDISKVLNLLHWIHDLIPHDGNNENPVVKNAMSLIKTCKKEERGLNCRGLATVLNECYLSLGFKSRFVTCMPKDSVFNDCHVINTVYIDDLDKWIWVDPTHDAYILDETGAPLGLGEVRERLITDKMLILNPDANWNNQFSTLKENYLLHYMAKNLYRLESPLHSQHNFETARKGNIQEYVELLPLDGLQQLPKIEEKTYEKTGVTVKTYKTNNPDIFWAKPVE